MKRLWLIWLCIGVSGYIVAQSLMTTVVGEVYDERTLMPIPNVNVYIKHTEIGTTTTNEGIFLLRAPIKRTAQLVVSAIGYKKQTFRIEPGQDVGIDIALQEQTTQLADIFIVPGTNPALALMQRVREHKRQNTYPVVEEDYDHDFAMYLSHIHAKHLRRRFWQQLSDGMIEQADSTFAMPLYVSERQNGQVKTYATIMTETDYDALLADVDRSVNFYSNTFSLYGTSFLSPLASNGNTYYHYYLVDSFYTNQGKAYLLHFKAKNLYYPTFNGQMTIDSASCALLDIRVELPEQSNVNFLRGLSIEQHFDTLTHELHREHTHILLDVAIKADTSRTFPTVLMERTLQKSHSPLLPISTEQTAWEQVQSVDTSQIHESIIQLNNTPIFRIAKFIAYLAQRASIPTGTKVDIGNVTEIIHFNPIEKVRLGLPLKTNEKLWKNVCLEAYAAYGWGDQAWKGMGKIAFNLPTQRRNILSLSYSDDYEFTDYSSFSANVRENATWLKDRSLTSLIFRPVYLHNKHQYNLDMLRVRQLACELESDWTENLESQLHFSLGRMGYGLPTSNYAAQPSFRYARIGATFRLGWGEKKVDSYFHRIHVYSHLPVVFINGEVGSYQLEGRASYELFSRLRLMVKQNVPLGVAGELNYLLEGGILFGKVPYPLLTHFGSNASYAYQQEHFAMMQSNAYAADNYLTLHAQWNGKGCLFDLIPGIQRLNLRELVMVKMLWGGLREQHEAVIPMPLDAMGNRLYNQANVPYVEVGVGLGNILRLIDIYSIWRVTHMHQPIHEPKWSVRFCFNIDK